MKFIKKLYNNIIDSMYYVELQLITYFATTYIVYIVFYFFNEAYNKDGALGWAWRLSLTAALLYLVVFAIFLFHLINKKWLKKTINKSFNFSIFYKRFYTSCFILNIICHIIVFILFIFYSSFFLLMATAH